MGTELDELQQWAGKTETLTDRVTAAPLAALNATLELKTWAPHSADVVPPYRQWLRRAIPV